MHTLQMTGQEMRSARYRHGEEEGLEKEGPRWQEGDHGAAVRSLEGNIYMMLCFISCRLLWNSLSCACLSVTPISPHCTVGCQDKYTFGQSMGPYALMIKHQLRDAMTIHLRSSSGGNMGTKRGISVFMGLASQGDVTPAMIASIDELLKNVAEGVHDEPLFEWSAIGLKIAPTTVNTKEINRYMEATIGVLLGTQHDIV
jgi:hypothetical protein